MRSVFLGLGFSIIASLIFSLLFSFMICLGLDPEARGVSEATAPLLGVAVGAWLVSRSTTWKTGLGVGLCAIAVWIAFWFYVMGRLNPLVWFEEGLPHLGPTHFLWWGLTLLTGAVGGWMRGLSIMRFSIVVTVACLWVGVLMFVATKRLELAWTTPAEPIPGYRVERQGPVADGTSVYLLTFDFHRQSQFRVGVYDCDSDDSSPHDDANTSFLGQNLTELAAKLDYRAQVTHRQFLCAVNGGFFGESGLSVAHHQEPMVFDGRVLYNVDLLRPKDQAWFFAVNSPTRVISGQPRFTLAPSIPWNGLGNYQAVLGGVRPLRVNGKSLPLKPGAGSTTLRCSRTSVGWSADGNQFYILVVHDPDGEIASQIQRDMHVPQTGGWDVSEVQKFWERKQVPFAVLFDGGESTQLACRRPEGGSHYLLSGYQYSFTVGHFFQRPLLLSPPILPPEEAHRGVLNYLYVEGPTQIHQ